MHQALEIALQHPLRLVPEEEDPPLSEDRIRELLDLPLDVESEAREPIDEEDPQED